ncbi:MAG: zinc-ribbon domain-containing protein, partial [Candidatus Bathyarchaeia archaeon]
GIGSFVSYNIATDIEGQVQQVQVSQVKAAQLPLPYTVAIKYCRCGTVVPANAKYCSNCGSPLN